MNANRLIHEKSPYLLQHAHNPVDWYAWNEEAFQKARKEEKPIFLSIGYSTCHWCHVMEKESFENPEIAGILNQHFISIKVDREERPDIDNIYMQAVMAMTGSGGWPMSVFLTPDLKPFYGGTYFPPDDRWGKPGFARILQLIHTKWEKERQNLTEAGNEMERVLSQVPAAQNKPKDILTPETLQKGADQFSAQFDFDYGGFGDAPKFPRAHALSFLLRNWKRTGNVNTLEIVEKTMAEMARGGIYDQLGGGFHRYSTDRVWRIPHFEKMLYDQAILAKAYVETYQVTRKGEYAQTARGIFDYVLRDMTDSLGGFYSAEDADSAADPAQPNQKSEGAFFLWTEAEILKALGENDGKFFSYVFGILPNGNAIQDPHHEFEGKNVLYGAHSAEEAAAEFKKSQKEIETILEKSKKKLLEIRSKRLRPHLDDKVLTDWNGLMISALAYGGRALGETRYIQAAKKSADFILQKMKRKDGRLLHRWRAGEAGIPAFLDDYAFFANSLLDLYETVFDPHYLEQAKILAEEMSEFFWDHEAGGFYFSGKDAEKLITQTKELYDGAVPSGNSMAALLLLRIGRLTGERDKENLSRQLMEFFSAQIDHFPSGYPQMLMALDFAVGPSREIVIAGEEGNPTVEKFKQIIYGQFDPNQVIVFHPSKGENREKIESLVPFVKVQTALEGKPAAYVCKNYVCDLPVTDMAKLEEILDKD